MEGETEKTGRYEVVKVDEKHGVFRKAVPTMPMPAAGVCCVLNCVIPGLGTVLAGLLAACLSYPTLYDSCCVGLAWNLLCGLLQLLTTPLMLVGWMWSIMWAITFLQLSFEESQRREDAKKYHTASSSSSTKGKIPTG